MKFVVSAVLFAGVQLFFPCKSVYSQDGKATPLPNIVLIVTDDLGTGDLGCYGQVKIKTPNIDALASEGMKFMQFYAGTSVCAPSRASLLTGLHTGHTAVRGNRELKPEGQFPLPSNAFTIAEMLKKSGYVTGDFGKWGLGPVGSTGDPLNQGFDRFFGYNCQRQSHNYYPDHLWNQDQQVKFPGNTISSFHVYAPDTIQRKALSFISDNAAKPFFLYLSYTLPHAALQVKDEVLFERYKAEFNEQPVAIKTPWNGQGYSPQAYPHAAYATMVTTLDRYVGEVVNELKIKGLDQNTIIIFTSDNGPHREGGNDPDYFNSNMSLRGYKRDLYEGGIRTPMLVSWPSKIKKESKSQYAGAFWDLMPTFAEIIGYKLNEYTDGISFLPELLAKKQPIHEFLYWEFHEAGGIQALRMDQWKGVKQNVLNEPNSPIQLYDLKNDPGEKYNLAKKFPEIVKSMRVVMEQQHVENDEFPLTKKKNDEADQP
ncbi:MAG: arylsulfatase [Chitinophagaceae bacterium]|nr:arylsulfatase [Chitinophagaceae bacterium]